MLWYFWLGGHIVDTQFSVVFFQFSERNIDQFDRNRHHQHITNTLFWSWKNSEMRPCTSTVMLDDISTLRNWRGFKYHLDWHCQYLNHIVLEKMFQHKMHWRYPCTARPFCRPLLVKSLQVWHGSHMQAYQSTTMARWYEKMGAMVMLHPVDITLYHWPKLL